MPLSMSMSLHPALLCVVLAISACRDGLFVEGLALSRRAFVRGVASLATIATIAPSASAVDRQRMTAAAGAAKKKEKEVPSSPDAIAARVDAAWTSARGSAEIGMLYAPRAVVIRSTADRFEEASAFASAGTTLEAQPSVTLTPVSSTRDGRRPDVIHHIFRTCKGGGGGGGGDGACSNGYFRLERVGAEWKIATDVWTLTPLP